MKNKRVAQSAFFRLSILVGLIAFFAGALLALFARANPQALTRGQAHRAGEQVHSSDALPVPPVGNVQEAWIARYNGPENEYDGGHAIAVDNSGNVYVTGESVGSGTGADYLTIKYNASGQEEWVARYDGAGNFGDNATAIAIDDSGNVYVTGQSSGPVTDYDYATIKYDSSGQEQWVARYDGPAHDYDYPYAIAVDADGNVYVTGESVGSGIDHDCVTIKYNSSGQEQWVTRYNGPGNQYDYGRALAIDSLGNIYVAAATSGLGTYLDFTTIKYNSAGQEQWIARYNGPENENDQPNAIAIDALHNIYVTGTSLGSARDFDCATIKYDPTGQELWVARYDGPAHLNDYGYAMAADSSGNISVTGASYASANNQDYVTIRYNSSGQEQWVAHYDGQGQFGDYATAVAVDSSGSTYVTGTSYANGSSDDYVTIKYNSLGQEEWVARYNGPGTGHDTASGIAVDGSGVVYVTGASEGVGTGLSDCATIKYVQSGPTPTPTATPTETCVVTGVEGCGSTFFTPPTDFTVGVSCPIDPFSGCGLGGFTVNNIPADSCTVFDLVGITFHFNTSPAVAGLNTIHIYPGTVTCCLRQVDEFTCTFRYEGPRPTTPSPRPRPTPHPRP